MRALVAIALLVACETKSDKYCQSHQDDLANCGGSNPVDAPVVGPVCTGDNDCSGATPHCLDMMACVGCRDASDCNAQVCDATSHTCRACTANTECPSELCLPGGACAAPSDVAYVGGSDAQNTACTLAAPCATLGDAIALTPYPKYVRVLSDITETETVQLVGDHTLEVFGAGNKVELNLTGVGIDIKDQTKLTLHNVELSHVNSNPTASDDCLFVEGANAVLTVDGGGFTKCGGDGIDATGGKVVVDHTTFNVDHYGIEALGDTDLSVKHALFLDIDRSAIYGSSSKPLKVDSTTVSGCATPFGQGAAAIEIAGAIDLTNSIVVGSGDASSATYGTVRITSNGGVSHLDYVTIADNATAGLYCNNNIQTQLTNAIVTGNKQSMTCKASYALVSDMPDASKHSKTGDPKFLNTTDPTSAMFYRIGANSDAIGIGMMDGVTVDIDGDARASTPDVGADEYVP